MSIRPFGILGEPQAGDSMPANSLRVKLVKSLQQVEAKYKVVCS